MQNCREQSEKYFFPHMYRPNVNISVRQKMSCRVEQKKKILFFLVFLTLHKYEITQVKKNLVTQFILFFTSACCRIHWKKYVCSGAQVNYVTCGFAPPFNNYRRNKCRQNAPFLLENYTLRKKNAHNEKK